VAVRAIKKQIKIAANCKRLLLFAKFIDVFPFVLSVKNMDSIESIPY